jgi:hypothetical protein
MKYAVLKNQELSVGNYRILPIRDQDKFFIMNWRNEQIDILRQSKILTENDQTSYYKNVIYPDFSVTQPKQILFSYLFNDELIGYGGIVHLNWIDKRGEISFLLETSRNKSIVQFKSDYTAFLIMMKAIAFNELKLNKITTEAFDIRPYLIETLERNDFKLEGRLKNHNLINGIFVDSVLHACFNK